MAGDTKISGLPAASAALGTDELAIADGSTESKKLTLAQIKTYVGGAQFLLADGHATPFVFNDLLQMDDGSDFMRAD